MRLLSIGLAVMLTVPAVVRADAPRVAADIAPVHSLVARVMQGIGEPSLILPPGASPHGYSMRPSEAALLESADLVIWTGHDLTPWLEKPIGTLASGARVLELLDVDGTVTHAFRDDVVFAEDDDHDHGHGGHAHAHDKAHDKAHGHDHGHGHGKEHDDDHAHAHAGHGHGHDHAHDGTDPHAWLDPENAKTWVQAIAAALAEIDPAQADAYRANADAAVAEIDAVQTAISQRFAAAPPQGFVVFHDAYQYFERRFGVETLGAISLSDASEPGAARIAQLQEAIARNGVTCALAEPQFNPGLVASLFEGTDVVTGVIDPLGSALTPGPGLYAALLTGMADTLAACR